MLAAHAAERRLGTGFSDCGPRVFFNGPQCECSSKLCTFPTDTSINLILSSLDFIVKEIIV
jgi:hypothetical protein